MKKYLRWRVFLLALLMSPWAGNVHAEEPLPEPKALLELNPEWGIGLPVSQWFAEQTAQTAWTEVRRIPEQIADRERVIISGEAGSARWFHINVPNDTIRFEVHLQGGTGDADLYLRRGNPPTLNTFDYRPFVKGNNEEIIVDDPTPGNWHLIVHGHTSYEGASLYVHLIQSEEIDEAALAHSPRDMELAMYYEFTGLAETSESIRHNPEQQNRLLRDQGRAAFNEGDYERAAHAWSEWSRLDPTDPEPVSLIGDIHLRQGDLEKAVEFYQKSLAIQPGQISLMIRLSRLLDMELKRTAEARNLLNLYERLFPGNSEVMLAKSEWLLRRRRFDEAEELIQAVLSKESDNLRALTLLHGLLNTRQERFQNMQTIVRVGTRPGRELSLSRAILDNNLLARPEAWPLLTHIDRMAYHSTSSLARETYAALLPRNSIAVEDFRVGRISRNWLSSQDQMWDEDGSLILSADIAQTEAYLRLVESEAIHNGFIEASIINARGFFWLYARRAAGNMIRFGFDETGLMYQQVWMDGQLQVNESRLWSQPEGPSTLRLEVRADGVFTYINDRPAFPSPMSVPRDMGLGWWGVAPWAPEPGLAAVNVQRVSGGPLPTRLIMMNYLEIRDRTLEEVYLLQYRMRGASAVLPYWYVQTAGNHVFRLPLADDLELRLLSRFHRARIMPLIRLKDPLQPDWDRLIEVARKDRLDGFTIPMFRMPPPEWIAEAEEMMIDTGIAINLLLVEPNADRVNIREIAPFVGLFPGARRARVVPLKHVEDFDLNQSLDTLGDVVLELAPR